MPASSGDLIPDHRALVVAQLDGVAVNYGSTAALVGIDLRIVAGERVALVGSSGAGKSTLLGLLSGLVVPTVGNVTVLGSDRRELRGRRLRAHGSRIGTVRQQLDLAGSLRVVHNVNAGRLGRWSNWTALSSLVRPRGTQEVAAVLDRLGIERFLNTRTDALSGGEQQRVAVARVLYQQPELVLADEPVSAVDPRLSEDVLALLCGDDAPWTTVVSLHEPTLARRFATRVIGLSHGSIEFDCAAHELADSDLTALYRDETV